jgi:hypothetical protein
VLLPQVVQLLLALVVYKPFLCHRVYSNLVFAVCQELMVAAEDQPAESSASSGCQFRFSTLSSPFPCSSLRWAGIQVFKNLSVKRTYSH